MNKEDFDRLYQTAKRKTRNACSKVAFAAKKTVKWASENPDLAMSVIGASLFFTQKAWRIGETVMDNRHQNSRIYDHSLGMYWDLKHPLTANERVTIERRRKSGENYGQILSDMKLLKR